MSDVKTLEQELQELTEAVDYEVQISGGTSYLHVHIYYTPTRHRWHNGEIAGKLFGGPWKYRRTTRWVRKRIREHQRMLRDLGGVRVI